jgi:hypothetical protein
MAGCMMLGVLVGFEVDSRLHAHRSGTLPMPRPSPGLLHAIRKAERIAGGVAHEGASDDPDKHRGAFDDSQPWLGDQRAAERRLAASSKIRGTANGTILVLSGAPQAGGSRVFLTPP